MYLTTATPTIAISFYSSNKEITEKRKHKGLLPFLYRHIAATTRVPTGRSNTKTVAVHIVSYSMYVYLLGQIIEKSETSAKLDNSKNTETK